MTDKQIEEGALEIFEECRKEFWDNISEKMRKLVPFGLERYEKKLIFQSIIEEIEKHMYVKDSMDKEHLYKLKIKK